MRAIAAIAVVIFHARSGEVIGAGAFGVDLFFVISGFIIATITPKRSTSQFVADRVWRIYPLYFLCFAIYVLLVPTERSVCQDIASFTLLPVGCSPYLTPAWTLTYELMFYAMAAITIGARWAVYPLLVAAALLLPPILDRGSNLLFLEFLFGVVIASLPRREWLGLPLLACGAALLAIAPTELGVLGENPARVLYWGIPSAILVYGGLCQERLFAHSRLDWLVRLGDASYSIYLVHFILHRAAPMWWPVAIYAQVSVGYLFHLFAEKPLLGLRVRRREPVTAPSR
jgi:exopolysaccharide production protein ExoZ